MKLKQLSGAYITYTIQTDIKLMHKMELIVLYSPRNVAYTSIDSRPNKIIMAPKRRKKKQQRLQKIVWLFRQTVIYFATRVTSRCNCFFYMCVCHFHLGTRGQLRNRIHRLTSFDTHIHQANKVLQFA